MDVWKLIIILQSSFKEYVDSKENKYKKSGKTVSLVEEERIENANLETTSNSIHTYSFISNKQIIEDID